ncbi:hypothetical protein NHX12_023026 [Muraenolepis orangiensis]|uniref:AB hydrolase-1 domain-containing protein n=1 Tax=Muraenolepis orangiensis TaxID=630683 RepID=A0A9Q0ES60_9TELE|nr:hypothetical protein NHX12_023026 [Muraenolepis orangiensis]
MCVHSNRAAHHRVEVVKVLSALGYQVLSLDYRGFGDSTGEPTEESLTTDALWLYRWVKEHSGDSRVIIWGHSLGTGVATNTAVKLMEQGVLFDGVILEGSFKNIREHIPSGFLWCASLSWMATELLFLRDSMDYNTIVFPSDENLKKMRSPLLFLHSEDDHIAWFHNAQQLYQIALSVQGPERVRMVAFEGSLGYLHNGLYKDPRLPTIIKHTVPDHKWKEAQGKDSAWYHSSLKDGSPVIIYLHGFGDSTGEPTEESLTTDALWLYRWVKEHSGDSRVIIWGHSLGTGLKKMRSPLLFLHSEDDHIAWFHNAQQLYQIALSVQGPERVRMVAFEGSLGYLHNGLYKDPRLPTVIK